MSGNTRQGLILILTFLYLPLTCGLCGMWAWSKSQTTRLLGRESLESIKSSAKLLASIEAILNYLMGSSQWDIRLLPVEYAGLTQQPQGPIFEA